MTEERRLEIDLGQTEASDHLTKEEVKEGWTFCIDCDGLLVHKSDNHLCFMNEEEKKVYLDNIGDVEIV